MGRIQYLENKFDRGKTDFIYPNEYDLMKKDFKLFLKLIENESDEERSQIIKETYRYKLRLVLLVIFTVLTYIFEELITYDGQRPTWTNFFQIIFLLMCMSNFFYFYSFLKSYFGLGEGFRQKRDYFKFHYKLVLDSTSYVDYLNKFTTK